MSARSQTPWGEVFCLCDRVEQERRPLTFLRV